MLKKSNISWSSKQLVKMIKNNNISFDNKYQRKYVWDDKRKSLFIDSLIEGYPVPPMFAKKGNGIYEMVDGLQRATTVSDYVNDKFSLGVLPDITDDEGETICVSGKKYSELPENLQDNINSYMFTIYYFEDISDDELKELFFRLNNNLPLTTVELMRTKALSFDSFKQLAKHDVYAHILGKKELSHSVDEDMVIKMWIMLKDDEPCLDKKEVESIIVNEEITSDMENVITSINDYMIGVYDTLSEREVDKKIIKKCFTKTQYLSLTPVVRDIIDEKINISMDEFCDWIIQFFALNENNKKTTISNLYNENCKSGSAHAASIASRDKAIRDNIAEMLHKD